MPPHDPKQLLHQYFGFTQFRPGQRETMSALWKHRAALAIFPTGGGKSLCYQLPALMFDGLTLVVSPLIALMKDQIDFLRSRGIDAERLDSSLDAAASRNIAAKMRDGRLKLLYVAPERFNNERFLADLTQSRISLFAVDEAHCISEWGHNFRPDYLKLAEAARNVGAERVLALTATATPAVVEDICAAFRIPRDAAIVTGFYRPNLHLITTSVSAEARDDTLIGRLQTRGPGPTIVYVTLQKTAERIAEAIRKSGRGAEAYHAGMDSEARSAIQERWMAAPDGIVVATIAFGMGIDKADVRWVYHYNLPKSLESYSQEIGRAGRDGHPSTVEMLACTDDIPTLENFAFGDTPTESAIRSLIDEVLAGSHAFEEFDVSLYELSNRLDMRQLVLRTALTYLELTGLLKQGTPFYAGYEIKPLSPMNRIVDSFPGAHGAFVQSLFGLAKKGRIWYGLNPDNIAKALGVERRRIVKALEVMEERNLVELRPGDVRQRYTRLQSNPDIESIAADLSQRFHRRELQEVARLKSVIDLVTLDGCQVNALTEYFGEARDEPCGHCSWCVTRRPQALTPEPSHEPMPAGLNVGELRTLISENPEALGEPRQVARFLCGLSSPALIRSKLSRGPLFGALEGRRFMEVLRWCLSQLM